MRPSRVRQCAGVEILEERFHLPVHLENDMHYKVYGYYLKECRREDTVTILNYPGNVLPGMGTVVEGKVIKGWNQFAGMVGFLPYGITREEQLKSLVPGAYLSFLARGAASVIPLLNPRVIVLTVTWWRKDMQSRSADIVRRPYQRNICRSLYGFLTLKNITSQECLREQLKKNGGKINDREGINVIGAVIYC